MGFSLPSMTHQPPPFAAAPAEDPGRQVAQLREALALVEGRDYALPDDVKRLVNRVFGHRIVLARSSKKVRTDAHVILQGILDEIPVPA